MTIPLNFCGFECQNVTGASVNPHKTGPDIYLLAISLLLFLIVMMVIENCSGHGFHMTFSGCNGGTLKFWGILPQKLSFAGNLGNVNGNDFF